MTPIPLLLCSVLSLFVFGGKKEIKKVKKVVTVLDTWLASCGFREDHRDVKVLNSFGLLNLQWFWAKFFVGWRILLLPK